MSERLLPREPEPEYEDPREDTLIEGMPKALPGELMKLHDERTPHKDRVEIEKLVAEFERTVAAQIFEVAIETKQTETGPRTQIRVYVPKYENAGFLPQNQKRTTWEKWNDENHPVYQQNVAVGKALDYAAHYRVPLKQPVELPHIRIGMGTIYQFPDPERGASSLAIRVNNDPNNIYRNQGNPMSSLLKIVRRGTPPIKVRNSSVEEIIPAALEGDRIRPFYAEDFFKQSSQERYKQKALKAEGSDPSLDLIQHKLDVAFQPDTYDTGIDLIFDYSDFGHNRLYQMKNVNALLTPQGTLEVQTIVTIPKPDLLLDLEHESDILIVGADQVAEWAYAQANKRQRPFEVQSVIYGGTGRPTQNPEKVQWYKDNFRASPPLWAPFGRILEKKTNEG